MGQPLMTLLIILGVIVGLAVILRLIRFMRLAMKKDYYQGKIVIITGASRGFGRGFAETLAAKGASLVLAARNIEQLNDVEAACKAINPKIETLVIQTDVTKSEDLDKLVQSTIDTFGHIDILINNAGIRQGGSLMDIGIDSIHRQLEVNLMAPINLTMATLPHMLKRKEGYIIYVASGAGKNTEPYFVPYGTSKHGLVGFGSGIRKEFHNTGVKALVVNPGFADTDMVSDIGASYQKMGFGIIPVERVIKKTLDGVILGKPEVNIGMLSTSGGWLNALFPTLGDMYWTLPMMPGDFKERAREQYSE